MTYTRLVLVAAAVLYGSPHSVAQDCHEPIAELHNPQATTLNSSFGHAFALQDDLIIVGSPYYAENDIEHIGTVEVHDLDLSPENIYTIRSPRKARHQEFGWALDAWNEWILVGDKDYVYFFRSENDEWILHQEIFLDAAPERIDVDEGIAVVGCPFRQDSQTNGGAAFVFEYRDAEDKWVQTQEIVGSQVGFGSGFGTGVDRQGNRLVVGGYGDNEFGRRAGDAYVFEYVGDEWIETARLTASDAQPDDYFGFEVLLLDDEIFVGAYAREAGSRREGIVYRYQFDGEEWVERDRFQPVPQDVETSFGLALHVQSVQGDEILFVGCPAYSDSDPIGYFGDVYTYRKVDDEWLFVTRIPCPDNDAGYSFGAALDGRDEFVLAGAPWASGDGRVFRYDEQLPHWKLTKEFAPLHGSKYDEYARSLALRDGLLAVGMPGDNEFGMDAGAVHLYRQSNDPSDWIPDEKVHLDDVENYTGFGQTVAVLPRTLIASSSTMLHVFKDDGLQWTETTTFGPGELIRAVDAAQGLGNVVVAGTPHTDGARDREGAATIYREVEPGGEWIEVQRLTPPDEIAAQYFANDVSMDGAFLAASARIKEEDPMEYFHTVFLYRYDRGRDEWLYFRQFIPDHTQHGSFSTTPVSLLSDTVHSEVWVATGVESESNLFSRDGSVYLTALDSVSGDVLREHKLIAPIPRSNGYFGAEVSLSWIDDQPHLLVGETRNEGGLVHHYRLRSDRMGWERLGTFQPDSVWTRPGYFGTTIAADGSTAAISDPIYFGYAGRLFIYDFRDCKCLDLTIENLIAGEEATISITGGSENEEFVMMWSLKEGQYRLDASSWCADFGLQIPIGDPLSRLFIRSRFDADGEFETTRRIPPSLAGREIYFQAAQKDTCPDDCTSNVFRAVVAQ